MTSGGDFLTVQMQNRELTWRILTFGSWRRMFYKDKLVNYGSGMRTKAV